MLSISSPRVMNQQANCKSEPRAVLSSVRPKRKWSSLAHSAAPAAAQTGGAAPALLHTSHSLWRPQLHPSLGLRSVSGLTGPSSALGRCAGQCNAVQCLSLGAHVVSAVRCPRAKRKGRAVLALSWPALVPGDSELPQPTCCKQAQQEGHTAPTLR